jgi:hypothetical protein
VAARQRGRSRGIGRNRYGSRPTQIRAPLPVVIVVCDDARTAVSYFNQLKRVVKEKLTLTVIRNPHDRASAAEVVKEAIKRSSALQKDKSHDEADEDSAWALIDLEGTPDRRRAALKAKRDAKAGGIRVALSNPCYEVWTLLHLVDTGACFVNCQGVLDRIGHEWARRFRQPFGAKAQADYSKIIGDRHQAAARAKKHREANDPSWTEVYLLLEDIESRSGC